MKSFPWKLGGLLLLLTFLAGNAVAQQMGSLRGQVLDASGAVIPGASITLVRTGMPDRNLTSGGDGSYNVPNLPPGVYTVVVTSTGFGAYQNTAVKIEAGQRVVLDVTLEVRLEKQKVDVAEDAPIGVEPDASASAIVLKGKDLESLPDDPDDLADVLQAMAGPSAGPNGGQFFVDGFTGTRLPPKESIREIRINQNPFASEYDRLGFGRIEILTRPGMDRVRGSAFMNFNDESLNSRNPYAVNRAPYQMRMFGGNVGGPVLKNRASFFVSVQRREIDDNAVVHAKTLDSNFNVTDFNRAIVTPRRLIEVSPRFDLKLNAQHTLVASYEYERNQSQNSGIGDLTLPSRAFDSFSSEQTLRLTETAVLNAKTVNETRFQFLRPLRRQDGDNSIAAISVQGAFQGGGAQVGNSYTNTDRWELQNYTTRAGGKHTWKWGVRLRGVSEDDFSPSNYGGTWVFSGGRQGPALDSNYNIVLGADGKPVMQPIDSLERYRRTLALRALGLSPAEIRQRGGGASQFSISAGQPDASVSQVDFGGFVQDDWRLRQNLTLSAGLRYESQTNISSRANFAPRLSFAWSPRSGSGPSKTVFRGGAGVFYDRFSEGLVLSARRLDGLHQQQYLASELTDTGVLDLFPAIPSLDQLTSFAVPQNVRRIDANLRSPYNLTSAISVERQLPKNFTMAVSYIRTRAVHVLRSRNINAPLPGTVTASNRNGVRPLGDIGNVYEYESSGVLNQNQVMINASNRVSRRFTVFATYMRGYARSDTDGAGSFPANNYDLSGEYGRSSLDVRNRIFIGGSITLPRGVSLNPFVIASSGRPFNITTGQDLNFDGQFNERPTLATDLSRPSVVVTKYGAFDTQPLSGASLIERNFATGPGFFTMNLRLSKTFGFGTRSGGQQARGGAGQPGGREGGPGMRGGPMMGGGGGGPRGGGDHGGGGGMRGGGPGGFGGFGGASDNKYSLTLSINAQNLLNHTNAGQPIGNLNSPLFGQSTGTAGGFGFGPGGGSAAGNRRVEAQLRFNF